MLPYEVMQQAQAEFLDWHGMGVSIAEISHRSKAFEEVAMQSMQDLRDLLSIPSDYHILFLPGGSRTQFSAVPLNLLGEKNKAGYVETGYWGRAAFEEAARYGEMHLVANANEGGEYKTVPEVAVWRDFSDCAYLHYVDNETIHGIEFDYIPESGDVPLVCDMSSNFLSRPFDVSQYGLIYACAQKNISIAGITVVIVRRDLLDRKKNPMIPTMLDYAVHAKNHSLYNTAPTFPWYMAGLTFQWLKKQGGLSVIAKRNLEKSTLLYDYLDSQNFYINTIDKRYRSRMNVIFKCKTESLDTLFWQEAADAGLLYLKGHRLLGGLRASLYNAMPIEGVQALIIFMKAFSEKYGEKQC